MPEREPTFAPLKKYTDPRALIRSQIKENNIEIIDEKVFRNNDTYLFYVTPQQTIDYTSCIEYRYNLIGSRSRLGVYFCDRSEGGMCIMKLHKNTNGTTMCEQVRPWYHKKNPFTVHFHFERRPRVFRNEWKMKRYLKRVRRNPSILSKPVGKIQLFGYQKCTNECINTQPHVDKTENSN
uniref:FLYWCH-type domain-containing protein n=1 Tax=Strongyloides papillosus TaxID=174720 RepID=A0A0N5BYR5_STREA